MQNQQQPMMQATPKLYTLAKLLQAKGNKPIKIKTNRDYVQSIQDFINTVESGNGAENFADIIGEMQVLKGRLHTGSGGSVTGVNSYSTISPQIEKLYTRYSDKYDQLIQSGEWTSDPTKIVPKYSEVIADADVLLRTYNEYILGRISAGLTIPETAIPGKIISSLPVDYLNRLSSYNAWVLLKQQAGGITPLQFDLNSLLLTSLPQAKPVKEKVVPQGFTEIAVNTFFKKLESTVKNNYSDLMGEYIVPGASKSCKLFMDKNYNYIVVQGDRRQVFKDAIEARKFCLLGGFEADKVQAFRNAGLVTNKLKKPFRVVPRTTI